MLRSEDDNVLVRVWSLKSQTKKKPKRSCVEEESMKIGLSRKDVLWRSMLIIAPIQQPFGCGESDNDHLSDILMDVKHLPLSSRN